MSIPWRRTQSIHHWERFYGKIGVSVPHCGVSRNVTLPTDAVSASQPGMEAQFFPGQHEALDPVVGGLVFDRGGSHLPEDPFNHPGVLARVGVQVFGEILDVLPLDASDRPTGGQLGGGPGGEGEFAGEHAGRASGTDMDFFGLIIPEILEAIVFRLGSPEHGVLTENDPIAADDLLDRD